MLDESRKADLHTHTIFSDGILTPEELVEEAIWKGISAIGVTDHDSFGGIERALKAGKEMGVEIIPGVELSCELEGLEVHILGYLLQDSAIVKQCLDSLCADRQERMKQMIEKAQSSGFNIEYEDVAKLAKGGAIGRPHLARVMVNKGYAKNISEVFADYIGDDKSIYVPKRRLGVPDAIDLIHKAGGVAVIAHPGVNNLIEFIPLFIKYGIDGIEVFYSAHSPDTEKMLLTITEKYNLLVTGGSDYHGDPKHDRQLGQPSIGYKCVEKLKQAVGERARKGNV